jgi:hypothetical protein
MTLLHRLDSLCQTTIVLSAEPACPQSPHSHQRHLRLGSGHTHIVTHALNN